MTHTNIREREIDARIRALMEDVIDEAMGTYWDGDRLAKEIREMWIDSELQADSDDQNGDTRWN